MGLKLNGKDIASMKIGGRNVKEAWLNGEKVWPTSSSIVPIIQQISEETGNYPIHFCEFNNSLDQTPIPSSSNPNQVYKPYSWASWPSTYIF